MRDDTTVKELLESMNLTAEEYELHKDLIRKCLVSEEKITECAAAAKDNIEEISKVLKKISKNVAAMEEALEELTKEAEELALRMAPSDEFYRQ